MKLKIDATQPSRWLLGQNIVQGSPIDVDTTKLHKSQLEELRHAKGIAITTEAGAKVLFDDEGQPVEVKAAEPASAEGGQGGTAKPDGKKK